MEVIKILCSSLNFHSIQNFTATLKVTVDGGTNHWLKFAEENRSLIENKYPHLITGTIFLICMSCIPVNGLIFFTMANRQGLRQYSSCFFFQNLESYAYITKYNINYEASYCCYN